MTVRSRLDVKVVRSSASTIEPNTVERKRTPHPTTSGGF
jgi:hypothetical protein